MSNNQLLQELEQEFSKILTKLPSTEEYQVGQIIKGTVLQLEKDGALIDIGSKAEAFLPFKEVTHKDDETKPEELVYPGNEYELFILREASDKAPLLVSYKRVAQARGWVKL